MSDYSARAMSTSLRMLTVRRPSAEVEEIVSRTFARVAATIGAIHRTDQLIAALSEAFPGLPKCAAVRSQPGRPYGAPDQA